MRILAERYAPSSLKADLIAIALPEGTKALSGIAGLVDRASGRAIAQAIADGDFDGSLGSLHVIRPEKGSDVTRKLALVGLGKKALDVATARRCAAQAVKAARREKAERVALALDGGRGPLADLAAGAAEGALLGDYRFLKYKDDELKKYQQGMLESLALLLPGAKEAETAEKGIARGEAFARATMLARGMVNEPASEMTPTRIMETAKAIVDGTDGKLTMTVFDRQAMEEMKMGGVLAVAKGSDEPPYLLHIVYKPAKKAKKRIAIVGKGITFDSGGLSLKPAGGMEDMKIDMAGAAAMIGAMSALPHLGCGAEVHGIAALCENMPSGKAVKPGDIAVTMSGKTIEILNTDAEGRVTLADTLHYATTLKPDAIIDLATLTGACMVALGQEVAGMMGNNAALNQALIAASQAAGEHVWLMPLVDEYRPLVKSETADLRNTARSSYGGAITAGLFLEEFVGGRPWAHLDIAGPAWAERDTVPHQPVGATGFGVRTLLRYIEKLAA